MDAVWHVARDGGSRFGPYTDAQLKDYAAAGRILPTDQLWKEGMAQWVSVTSIPGLTIPPPTPQMSFPPPHATGNYQFQNSNKIAAGLCAILLGPLGVHKFILGQTTPGIIMLLVSIFGLGIGALVMWVIGIIEGITYLTKSDQEFHQIYEVQKKAWF